MTHVENHSLARDFPEHRARIHELKLGDAHFSRLFAEYESLDREIIRVEGGLEHRSDESLEQLKLRRVRLKDELYAMLVA